MRRKFVWVAAFAAIFPFSAKRAAADDLFPTNIPPAELTPPLIVITQLPTGVDLTLIDQAVTDGDLLTSGCDDTVPAMIDDPQMLIVDDDGMQCPQAQFTRINDAISAAAPGAIIRVCPGTYRESVHVNKPGLVLQAARQQWQATECQSPSTPDPTQEAIVVYHEAFPEFPNILMGFFIDANDVTIEGFTVQPDLMSVGTQQLGIGIFANNSSSGYDIRHNVVQNNSFGIDVNNQAGGNTTHVRENCLRNNNLNLSQGGFGVFSNVGLNNALIENNYCTGQRGWCILLTGGPNVNVQVNHNESVNDSTIGLFVTSNFTLNYNKVINPANTALMLGTADINGQVSFNNLYGGSSSANGISINASLGLANPGLGVANTLYVKSNKVTAFNWDGIHLDDGTFSNRLVTNRAENNVMAGIRATGQSSNNTIQDNHMRGDHPDCYDDTHGMGTSGTANFWIRDIGFTEFPEGICKHGNE